jgi:hypothetical protein
MKKYFLLLGSSIFAFSSIVSVSADDGLKAVKNMYLKEFQTMDTDANGQISEQEFLAHRFNSLRADIIDAEGFKSDGAVEETKAPVSENGAKATTEMAGIPQALNDMVNYELEDDILKEEPVRLTKEDVMPENEKTEPVEELDLSISEEENLQRLMAGAEEKSKAEETKAEENEQSTPPISMMLDTIKKTLPKKIDEITTWVDIKYADNVIDYIYKAEIDTSAYSEEEVKVLKDNIQNEACVRAYADMCPKIKPMFIDKGIDMRIVYLDKADKEISACEFNKITCVE